MTILMEGTKVFSWHDGTLHVYGLGWAIIFGLLIVLLAWAGR